MPHRRIFNILLLLALATLALPLLAAPLINVPQVLVQTDGTRLECFASGDEFYHRLHDAAGYTIVQEKSTGAWVYATERSGDLVPTALRVGKTDPASAGLRPGLRISVERYQARRDTWGDGSPARSETILQAPHTGVLNSVTIFIRFSDEAEFTDTVSYYDSIYNSSAPGYNSMRNYFMDASYGKLEILSHFFPVAAGTTVLSFQDSHPRNYFKEKTATNPDGYSGTSQRNSREWTLLKAAVDAVSAQVPQDLPIDADGDGKVDSVSFVVSGGPEGWSDLLWPHMWSMGSGYNATINGKTLTVYDFQLRDSVHSSGNGVLCHEMFHVLGAPDLYHYSYEGPSPTYSWDIMENTANPPQHMGAYMKYKYGHWIDAIPEISSPGTYALNPLTSPSGQVFQIPCPASAEGEFFVVEFRKKRAPFESRIPDSGLLIYRINPTYRGNASYDPSKGIYDEVYIYRPDGTTTANGSPSAANYTSDSCRVQLTDATNPSDFLTDGSRGGLVLTHAGTAQGETMTFQLGATQTCVLTCTVSSPPVAGFAPFTIDFDATNSACSCSSLPQFSWAFGDGGTSAQQNPSHTYATAGTFNWSLTLTLNSETCTKSGSIVISDNGSPSSPQKLVFVHHSTGGNWLADPAGNELGGDLGRALRDNNYFVSATNYGWGPDSIGDRTDIGHWWEWFQGPSSATYLSALYAETGQNFGDFGSWPRLASDPGGPNTIVMFKSCFPNSNLGGSPSDPIPPIDSNPLRGQDCYSGDMTFSNAKGIYIDLLNYFQAHPEKLFIAVVQPPLMQSDTDASHAANARALADWLVNDWLDAYPLQNVFVFDFFNVLTSDGGSNRKNNPDVNDLGWVDGNHHRYRNGTIQHSQTVSNNYSAYWSGDSHPSRAGNEKATGEFVQLLNLAYHCWKGTGDCPGGAPACSLTCSTTVPTTGTAGTTVAFQSTATATNCSGGITHAWNFGDGANSASEDPTHTYATAGTYNWTYTATVSGTTPCTHSGSITVSTVPVCTLTCSATVPTTGTAGAAVSFQSSATATDCTGGIAYAWDFGDGANSASEDPTHTYAAAGTYNWTYTATVSGTTPCTHSGSITVNGGGAFHTYYVRTDGGDASQCTGLVDAAYPGSGTGQPCGWNHPFQALPPGGPARIAGGDTLVIHAGNYRMGHGAPGAEACSSDYPWDCYMASVPSGPDASHPTRIVGEMTSGACTSKPELWGTERAYHIVDLHGSSHVELSCLDITDHASCIEDHNAANLPCSGCTARCQRDTFPYGDWAMSGISGRDSDDVRIADVDVHGLANMGIHAGRISNWTLDRVRINGNGWSGWNGDLWDPSSNSGTILFRNVEIAYNGCSEAYPAETITMNTCWGQEAGGYGDGLGTTSTGGRWVFEGCNVHHNTSDGIDLLCLDPTGSVEVRSLWAVGNAGNQLKTSGGATVENSVLVGNCAYFEGQPLMGEGDLCRALGNTVSLDLHRGNQVTLVNNTITGQGDCLLVAGCNDSEPADPDPNCDGTERILVRNTLFFGNPEWRQPAEMTCLAWYDDGLLPANPLTMDYNLVFRTKDDPCPGSHDVCGQDPLLFNAALSSFDGHLKLGSPAINMGAAEGAPATDYDNVTRAGFPDIGAYEYDGNPSCTLTCSATVPASGTIALPVSFMVSATTAYCTGGPSFSWDFGDGQSSGEQNPTHLYASVGTYGWAVTATVDGQSCVQSGSLIVDDSCTPPITGPAPACMGASLSTQAYTAFQWYRNGSVIGGATGQTYFAPAPGTYTVRVTGWNGCTGTSAGLVISSSPTPTITGPSVGCTSVGLSTSAFSTYQWNLNGIPLGGANEQNFIATQSGIYSVTVTNVGGCTGTSTGKTVTITGPPTPTVSGDTFNTCPTTSVTLISSPALGYQWTFAGTPIPGATNQTYDAMVSGDYGVIATDGDGCQGSSAPHALFVDFCPSSEVSPKRAVFPARLVKDAASSTGYYIYFQRLDTLDGYNLYEGNVGAYYSHGGAPGNACNFSATDLGTGEMQAEITPSAGNHYYLVTPFGGGDEGPSGFNSQDQEISPSRSTCLP